MDNVLTRNLGFIFKAVSAVLVVALVMEYSTWAQATSDADAAVKEQMAEAQRADTSQRGPYATDGTFTGTAQGYGGPITCTATVENGYITNVAVVDHSGETEPYYSMAAALEQTVVDEQTTAVDTVSGATLTSAGILNATTQALNISISGSGSGGGE